MREGAWQGKQAVVETSRRWSRRAGGGHCEPAVVKASRRRARRAGAIFLHKDLIAGTFPIRILQNGTVFKLRRLFPDVSIGFSPAGVDEISACIGRT